MIPLITSATDQARAPGIDAFVVHVLLVPYVTCSVSVPEFPAPSLAVTVITLSPLDRLTPEIVQETVPVAVPLPPLLLLHAILLMPLELSDALPPMLIVLLVAV